MKCMCAQTRPRFILSSEGVFWGMEFEPMLTPREKSPLPENVPRGGSNPRRCGQRAQALPTELFRPPITTMMMVMLAILVIAKVVVVVIVVVVVATAAAAVVAVIVAVGGRTFGEWSHNPC